MRAAATSNMGAVIKQAQATLRESLAKDRKVATVERDTAFEDAIEERKKSAQAKIDKADADGCSGIWSAVFTGLAVLGAAVTGAITLGASTTATVTIIVEMSAKMAQAIISGLA